MKLKLSCLFFIFSLVVTGQDTIPVLSKDSASPWRNKNKVGFDISQIAFINWSAGGNSAISGLIKGDFSRVYTKGNQKWVNELIVRYGLNQQDGVELRKTDDLIQLNSTFGYRKDSISNWYHSAKFNFNTQFSNGYAYPNTEKAISRLFAPAYILLGVGTENSSKSKHRVFYLSPFTFKTTFVLDQTLANQGAFGVTEAIVDSNDMIITNGKQIRTELGFLFSSYYKKEIAKNIVWVNKLVLFSDYINKFGNIDIDYDFKLDMTVNQYVKVNIGARIIYDDDVKAKEQREGKQVTLGPKLQIRQMLGVGLVYTF
ncbi:MAG: DUF3078 domain-containing protein [Flavobacterium sp.]|nr:DUF3078 domain-containing protein [Flavobacterium sp.]